MATRNSKVILAKNIRLDRDYKNVINYSESSMVSLVTSKAVATVNECSFLRQDQAIEVQVPYGTALQANYIAFQNSDYSNKWFFAFVDRVEYKGDRNTRIYYTVDEFSTWFDYWTPTTCFIEREHVNDDGIGKNTVPEQLETGEYVEGNLSPQTLWNFSATNNYKFVLACNRLISEISNIASPATVSATPDGLIYLGFSDQTNLAKCINLFTDKGHPDYIEYIFSTPVDCWSSTGLVTYDQGGSDEFSFYQYFSAYFYHDTTITTDNKLAGNYTPRNNKLLTYPYRYMLASNECGGVAPYMYEYFTTTASGSTIETSPVFDLRGCGSVGCDIRIVPRNYKGKLNGWDDGLTYGKMPVGLWSSDVFTNWLTTNGLNLGAGAISSTLSIVEGVVGVVQGEGTVGLISSGINGIFGTVCEVYKHKIAPDQIHGESNIGNLAFAGGHIKIVIHHKSIKPEFARIIDDYFDRFGYAIHRVKTPNQTGRQYWNFVKIGSGEIIGYSNTTISVPPQSMLTINNIYRAGVTIWHNHDNIGNFSLNNAIIS